MPAPWGQPLLVTGSSERNHSGRPSGPMRGKRPRGQAADREWKATNKRAEGPPKSGAKLQGGGALRDGVWSKG